MKLYLPQTARVRASNKSLMSLITRLVGRAHERVVWLYTIRWNCTCHTQPRAVCVFCDAVVGHTLVYVWGKYIEHILPYSILRTHSSCYRKTAVIHVSVCRSRRAHTDVYYDPSFTHSTEHIWKIFLTCHVTTRVFRARVVGHTPMYMIRHQNEFYSTWMEYLTEYILYLLCTNLSHSWYGVATVSRIDEIIGLFCRISSLL